MSTPTPSSDLPDDWYENTDGRERCLSVEKVRATLRGWERTAAAMARAAYDKAPAHAERLLHEARKGRFAP